MFDSTSFTIKKFLDAGYKTFINNPSFLGATWSGDPEVAKSWGKLSKAENLIGKYNDFYLHKKKLPREKKQIKKLSAGEVFQKYLLPFSLFKTAPEFLRPFFIIEVIGGVRVEQELILLKFIWIII